MRPGAGFRTSHDRIGHAMPEGGGSEVRFWTRGVSLALCLCVALAGVVPAAAQSLPPGPGGGTDVWSEWETINSTQEETMITMDQVHVVTRDLVTRLFAVARDLIRDGSIRTVLDILEWFANLAGILGDRFAWVYAQAARDMKRFLYGDPDSPWSGAWHASNSDRTADVAAKSMEERLQTGNSSRVTETGLEETREIAHTVNSRRDLEEGARMTWNAGEELGRQATNIPSTRAGIQALLAGQAAALKGQAVQIQGLGQRINAVAVQNSVLSQQLHAANQNLKQIADSEQRRQEMDEKSTQQTMEVIESTSTGGIDAARDVIVNTIGITSSYKPFGR